MNKSLYFLLILLFMLGFSGISRAAGYGDFISCNSLNPTPKIVLKTSYGKLEHDLTKSIADLTHLSGGDERFKEEGIYTAGLAPYKVGFYVYIKEGIAREIDKNTICVMPTEVEAFIGYQQPGVYVNNTVKPGTCEYALILRHEQVHQWINKLTLDYFLPLYYKALVKTVKDVKAVKVKDSKDIKDGLIQLNLYYNAKMTPVFEQFRKAVEGEQKKLDNWVNYNAEDKLCKEYNEKQKLMNQKFD